MNASMYRDIRLQSALELRLGLKLIFQQDNHLKHIAKITKEWLQYHCVIVTDLKVKNLNSFEHLWKYLKLAVHGCSPSNLMKLEQYCKDKWEKWARNRCVKHVASQPQVLRV